MYNFYHPRLTPSPKPEFYEELPVATLLIGHPAQGREWKILREGSVRGFYLLQSVCAIGRDPLTEQITYQHFSLLLPSESFERIQ